MLDSVKEPVLNPFKDMILEAISAKLSTYEHTTAQYSINVNPRECYKSKNEKVKKIEKEEIP